MTTYTLTVPVEYEKSGRTERSFKPVGFVFENTKRDTGETFLTIRLDFPVAVTELVAFQRKPREDGQPPLAD